MEVHVTPLKSKGQTKQKWMRAMGNAVGTLRVGDKRDTVNLRSTRVAELVNHRPVRAEGEKWILFDVQLVWAKGGQFLLSGYERHVEWNGDTTDYAQIWLVTVQPPGTSVAIAPETVETPNETPIEDTADGSYAFDQQ